MFFLIVNSIKIVLKKVGGFVKQANDNLAIINDLRKEIQCLKNILEREGISYRKELDQLKNSTNTEIFETNQGSRIVFLNEITKDMANRFFARFWGRTDVYAKRVESKKTNKAGYYPQCINFWSDGCGKKWNAGFRCQDCHYQKYKALTIDSIMSHLKGNEVIGVYPLYKDNTCRFLVFDFDNHDKDARNDFANIDESWKEEVNAMRTICQMNGIDPLIERSRSGKGAHIWIFFDKPISAILARNFGNALLDKGAEQVNLKSFKYYDRIIPAQDSMPKGGLGNLIALPLQGQALKYGNSAFIDENWNAYANQWNILWSKPKLSQAFIEEKIKEWHGNLDDKPWDSMNEFEKNEVDGKMHITLSNGIYVDTSNLSVSIQNKIRKLARISNPIYYKNQAMGISTFGMYKYIYLGEDHDSGYIQIPRGCYDTLISYNKNAGIQMMIDDKRQQGRSIDVTFKGELKPEQNVALNKMIEHDNGILLATTAFGKTVLCADLIATKKVNTLILLESSSLLEQWKDKLQTFLDINEELPEYTTPKGLIKKRKSLIGTLQGSHDSMAGIIDIAMAGSICKKGKFHKLLNEYGMIIVDECHHAASNTESAVLKEIKAKYVYGVTAVDRTDQLDKMNFMLIGPIRHKYSAKEQAKQQGIPRLLYPRFTHVVAPRGMMKDEKNPNEAYSILRDNDLRDQMIIQDIKECIKKKRTPVVLSKYVNHCKKLYKQLEGVADSVFLLIGSQSKKENNHIVELMKSVPEDKTMILVATGSLVGEGFDLDRLDTLFLAMPVASSSVIEQFTGRIHRLYDKKDTILVYDYVDVHIPMFDRMYGKRLKAYKESGYELISDTNGIKNESQISQSIYDASNYYDMYSHDLMRAKKNIIVSSPSLSGDRVLEFTKLIKEKMESGVEVTIVSWMPDKIRFGSSNYRMQLLEEMRQSGFYLKSAEDNCEHFAIIDQEIVWYGNINLLGKQDVEDHIMRIQSKEIASELMEMTFGNSLYNYLNNF